MHHEDNIRECQGRMKLYDEMVAMLEDKVLDNVNDNNLLFRLYCQVLINSFAILDPEKRSKFTRVGAVLYIEGSAYDHSCEPNSIQWFIGTKLQIKALRDFDTKTEPVLIHYIDLKLPLDERRCKLLKQYYFKCECSRCITEAMGMRTIDYDSMYQLEEEARKITREFACTDKLTVDKLSAIKWALEFHRVRMKLLPLYEKSYGKNHPYVKHVIQNISDLKTKLEKIDDGMKTIIDDDKSMISNVSEFKEIESPST
ncbi:Histone-lysine N-methyltransferase SMYD3 [Halotydeus destructor]|nr:Histone-lysine N-methyltransferase SMYD3 [Halotydeus destructor]